jgi:hypothetical protein
LLAPQPAADDHGHWPWSAVAGNAITIALELWDADAWRALTARHERFARDNGALVQLQFALDMRAWTDVLHVRAVRLAELAEAAARTGDAALSSSVLEGLGERTGATWTEWLLGTQARTRALLSEGATAEGLYREAIRRFSRTWLRPELARGHLLHGEWLRREGRRVDARDQLRTAHEMLAAVGMEASRSAPAASFSRPARRCAGAWSWRARSSRARGGRSPGSLGTASPTPRSAPGCSSAPGPSNGTWARCSPSSWITSRMGLRDALPAAAQEVTRA